MRETSTDTHVFLGIPAVVASEPMRRLVELAERVARTGASVLISGESGSGKEMIARAVHHYSPRSHRPWVDLNCAALPENLLESELFGYEKGAFSGADATKPGLFELAHQGTIFLDEIGEIDPRVQVKLLRVLDGAPYFRLGGVKKVSVDVRVVAATNTDLDQAVSHGRFRNDLYHRLSQFTIEVPPLRARVADVVPLAQHFLLLQYPGMRFSPAALDALCNYRWPGNIRELRNAVMRAGIVTQSGEIQPHDLPFKPYSVSVPPLWTPRPDPLREGEAPPEIAPSGEDFSGSDPRFHETIVHSPNLESMERHMIFEALHATGGHHQKAAARLGISRRTLSRKLKVYGTERDRLPLKRVTSQAANGQGGPAEVAG
jgi:transcriptional regulator with PAS, ATPase and Fis domain